MLDAYEVYYKQYKDSVFFNAEDFSKLTGELVAVQQGSYKAVTGHADAYIKIDDIKFITDPSSARIIPFSYKGNVVFDTPLEGDREFYLLSDGDFKKFQSGLTEENMQNTIVFNVENWRDSYLFARRRTILIMGMLPAQSNIWRLYIKDMPFLRAGFFAGTKS